MWAIVSVLSLSLAVAMVAIFLQVQELREQKQSVIGYTATGIPRFVETFPAYKRQIIEVQTFVKEVLTRTFTMNYAEFLERSPEEVFTQKKLEYFYDPKFLAEMIASMKASGFIAQLIKTRAVIFVHVLDPVEVKWEGGAILARARVKKTEKTATGERSYVDTYLLTLRLTGRTIQNPWGLIVTDLVVSD